MSDRDTFDSTGSMAHARFGVLAEAWGGDIARWPEAERRPARDVLSRSRRARRILAAAQHLDAVLARLPAPPPASAQLRRAVAALQPLPERPRRAANRRPWSWLALLARGVSLTAAAAAGVLAGIALAPVPEPDPGNLAPIEAALIVGEAPTTLVGYLMEEF